MCNVNADAANVPNLPEVAIIDVFDACTLRCPLCPTGANAFSRPPARMTLATFSAILEQLATTKRIYLFNWGESLLHPGIIDFIRAVTARGKFASISSNLCFQKHAGFFLELVRAGLGELVASIDGITQESYSAYRRGGNLELVLRNLRELVRAKESERSDIRIVWKFLVNRHTEGELDQARTMAEELGVTFRAAAMGLASDLLDWSPNDSLEARIREWLPSSKEYWSEPMKNGEFGICSYNVLDDQQRCHWLWDRLVISPRGDVFPCCWVTRDESAFGNVLKTSVAEVWGNERFRNARALFTSAGGGEDSLANKIVCHNCSVARLSQRRCATREP